MKPRLETRRSTGENSPLIELKARGNDELFANNKSIFPTNAQIAYNLASRLFQTEISLSTLKELEKEVEDGQLTTEEKEKKESKEEKDKSSSDRGGLLQMLLPPAPPIIPATNTRISSPYVDALVQLYASNRHLAMSLLASSSTPTGLISTAESSPPLPLLVPTPLISPPSASSSIFSPPIEKHMPPSSPERRSSESSRGSASTPMDLGSVHSDVIVPSNEKEGWCRNKKYIEKVDAGYMCTVCKKVYGRYNSVSYHVTIYHRNPPIRCEQPGCTFTTREARYIHFHKYYRHHIPLPDNIDLGSRKCPFCRHVSKSPAMLEKHIARHVPGDRTARSSPASTHASPPAIPSPSNMGSATQSSLIGMPLSVPAILPQLPLFPGVQLFQFSIHPTTSNTTANSFLPSAQLITCNQCDFRTNSVLSLSQHLSISHASMTFTRCTLCDFHSSDANTLLNHISETHQ